MSDIQIVPAILATNEQEFQDQLSKIESAQALENSWVHFDFMDNKFVPNKSIEPSILSKTHIPQKKEAHLMVQEPIDMLKELGQFNRIIIHVESDDVKRALKEVVDSGKKAGLALKYETPLEEMIPYLMDIELVLIMSIEVGFQGQPFIEGALEKVRQVVHLREENNLKFQVAVDGAVKDTDANLLVTAGADQLVVGSFLQEGDIDENIKRLKEVIYG